MPGTQVWKSEKDELNNGKTESAQLAHEIELD